MLSRLEIEEKPSLQFVLLLFIFVISIILFTAVGGLFSFFLYDLNPEILNNIQYASKDELNGVKLIQLFSGLGGFIVAPLFYAFLTSKKTTQKLGLTAPKSSINFLLVFIFMISFTPFLSWLIDVNTAIVFPEFMGDIEKWMLAKQDLAAHTTKAYLSFEGIGELIILLIIVVIIPALGEELLFRGALQQTLINWTKNHHVGIWITAFLFGAVHMQFYSFAPIMLMGALFGYLFYWSKSLWLPIVGHFINNGTVVIASYFYPEMVDNADISIFGDNESSAVFYVASFIVSTAILYLMWKINTKKLAPQL
ncbi:MAG: hypothetical protein COB15_04360 [Flavobacteriales bacterium]|nr:MAG: hypothetical protein COB15_04360 [Flavobacteriales bacterium]